jgi:shikimate dehydrogenase
VTHAIDRGTVDGATSVAAVIGDPIAHSRSPALFNAAFAATGLNWVFTAFRVPPGRAAAALRGARDLGLAGLTVTMPHKSDAALACDELTSTAQRLGAVNAVAIRDGRLVGDSTDGAGFVAAIEELGIDPIGGPFLVLGAGGAGRAIVDALGARGAAVLVAARRADAATAAAALAPGGQAVSWDRLDAIAGAVDVVVNATPIGMNGEPPPFDVGMLRTDQRVIDTVYHPAATPLVVAAHERGVGAVNGLGMLVHQAARIFELFTDVAAPMEAMWTVARRESARSAQ